MVFTPIYPFSISTRYLLFPAIGLVWILSHFLKSLPRPKGKLILTMLLFTQAAAIIGNSQKYQSENKFLGQRSQITRMTAFFFEQIRRQLRADERFIRSRRILLRQALTHRDAKLPRRGLSLCN